jgi:two-component system sensor histidine kinase PrrB
MRAPRSLRAQITLSAALLVCVVVALSGVVVVARIDHQDRAQVDRQLRARAVKVQADSGKARARGSLLAENDKPARADDANLLAGTDSLTRVLAAGEVVAQRGEGIPSSRPVPARSGVTTITVGGRRWRSLVGPTNMVAGGRLQVLQSLGPVQQRLDDNRRVVALVTGAASLATALAAWLITGLVLRPLERLRDGALAIRPGDTAGQRLPEVERPQEIGELSATLNAMLERLQVSMAATRRFTADAGHELRTPLTGLGVDLETLQRNPDLPPADRAAMLGAMAREHRRIVALLDGLQQLARGDAEALPRRAHVDVAELLDLAVGAASGRHPGVHYSVRDSTPAVIDGWSDGIRLALDNLLDNAALHGREDGNVEVAVSARDGAVRIDVDDDGPGIAAPDREPLAQRFARGAAPRSPGSGLGLALADQQARLHGGRLELGAAPAGGLRATLTLACQVTSARNASNTAT